MIFEGGNKPIQLDETSFYHYLYISLKLYNNYDSGEFTASSNIH